MSFVPLQFDGGEKLHTYVTHNHDIGATVHEAVHDRFGARLHYHSAEHDAVTEKTLCPAEEFGDDGDGGKNFLFTSHVNDLNA